MEEPEAPQVEVITKHEIPLLRIAPSTDDWKPNLETELLSVPVEELPDSFTIIFSLGIDWQKTAHLPLTINGRDTMVPEKLFRALVSLRYHKKPRLVLAFDLPMTKPQAVTVTEYLAELTNRSDYLALWRDGHKEGVLSDPKIPCLQVLLSSQGLHGEALRFGRFAVKPFTGENDTLVVCEPIESIDDKIPPKFRARVPILVLEPAEDDSELIECKTVYLSLIRDLPDFISISPGSAPHGYIEDQPKKIMSDGFRKTMDYFHEAALRRLRHSQKRRYIHTVYAGATKKEGQLINSPHLLVPRSTYVAVWIDPETAVDYSFTETLFQKDFDDYETRKVDLDEPLDPMSLFMVVAPYHIFRHYRPMDLSPESQEIRLLKYLDSEEGKRLAFEFVHFSLDDPDLPEYFHIQPNGFERPDETNWAEITIDGHTLTLSRIAESDLRRLKTNPKAQVEYLYIHGLCQDLTDEKEVAHFQRIFVSMVEHSKMLATLLQPNSHDRLMNINKIEQFVHPPLNENERQVRLLRLFSSNGDKDAPVRLEIVSRNLDELEEDYYALSYVWGFVTDGFKITINDHPFLVATNLDGALRRLRNDREDIYCWIDAICIDQINTEERGQQVRLMRDIYSKAKQVIAWLGPQGYDSDLALSFLNQIGKKFQVGSVADLQQKKWNEEELKFIHKGLQDERIGRAVVNFYRRDWWQRLWVMQEAVLAPSLVLYCGQDSIDWEVFERAFARIDAFLYLPSAKGQHEIPEGVKLLIRLLSNNASAIAMERARVAGLKDQEPVIGDEFLWYLSCLGERKYSEPRDIVFSALGLLSEIPPGVDIDYKVSIRDVYYNTAKAILDQRSNLKLLSFCKFSARRQTKLHEPEASKHKKWPSWVPDWRRGGTAGLGSHSFLFGHEDQHLVINPQLSFNAGGKSKSDHEYQRDGQLLLLKGVRLGTITNIIPRKFTIEHIENEGKKGEETLLFYSNLHAWEAIVFSSGNDNKADTDSSTTTPEGKEKEEEDRETGFLNALRLESREKLTTEEIEAYRSWRRSRNQSGKPPSPEDAPAMMSLVEDGAGSTLSYRGIMTTDAGYFGIAGEKSVPGDIVCVLKGGDLAFVLRPVGDGNYFLVSDAYVHGVMDGEIFQGVEEGKHQLEQFGLL